MTSNVARRYFEALGAHDLDAAVACWRPGGVDRLVGTQALIAPEGIRAYFSELFAAFPDFSFQILQELVDGSNTTIRWRARATFAGPGRFQGVAPNGARMEVEGCDVVTASDGLIVHPDAYMDSGEIARQLSLLPPLDSKAQSRLNVYLIEDEGGVTLFDAGISDMAAALAASAARLGGIKRIALGHADARRARRFASWRRFRPRWSGPAMPTQSAAT